MAITVVSSNPAQVAEGNYVNKVTADANNLGPSVGFFVDATGTLSLKPRHNSALITMLVVAGTFYPIDVVQVDITGSTTTAAVYLLQSIP
jgi:hypothetical protein